MVERIQTTTVGSYPVPDWLVSMPSEQAVVDATRVIVNIQRQAGIDLPTDGEIYRFDINHPDTNGMIDYFVRPLGGVRWQTGRSDWAEFSEQESMSFRDKPAGVVEAPLHEGSLNLVADCQRTVGAVGRDVKFTVTSPYMLARTLVDRHYGDFESLLMALADILASQIRDLDCACVQVDEANITGNPDDGPIAAAAINRLLDSIRCTKALHLCFGNYGGQTIQLGQCKKLVHFLNLLHADHVVLEMAHRPKGDLFALREVQSQMKLGIGVIDVKINHVETPDEVARRIEEAENVLGQGRIGYVHPDCGFWMLKRSVADRKIASLVKGRNLYLGIDLD